MVPIFQIVRNRDRLGRKRWRWNLIASNGEVVATSEAYNSRSSAYHGAEVVGRIAGQAVIDEFDEEG